MQKYIQLFNLVEFFSFYQTLYIKTYVCPVEGKAKPFTRVGL